eukprot:10345419-Alexandrium_andersonii.AAC.1
MGAVVTTPLSQRTPGIGESGSSSTCVGVRLRGGSMHCPWRSALATTTALIRRWVAVLGVGVVG